MNIPDLAVAVFIGNMMTLAAFYSLREFSKHQDFKDAPWLAFAGWLLPIGFALLALI